MSNNNMTTDIIDSIIDNDPFEDLRYLKPEDYHTIGIDKDTDFIKDGWEVFLAGTDDDWFFLFHPERRIISMRFTRRSCLYRSLYARCMKAKSGKVAPKKPKGLGDRVESIAKPIAKVIDAVAGTDIQNCPSCKKRKNYLNEKFPIT